MYCTTVLPVFSDITDPFTGPYVVLTIVEDISDPRENDTVCVSKISKHTASVDVVVILIAVELFSVQKFTT